MAWFIFILGGLCEVGWLIGLKHVNGSARILPWIVTVGFMIASLGCLGLAIRSIPMGTAYAVWTARASLPSRLWESFFSTSRRP